MNSKLISFVWQSLNEKPLITKTIFASIAAFWLTRYLYRRKYRQQSLKPPKSKELVYERKRLRVICGALKGKTEKLANKCYKKLFLEEGDIYSNYLVEWIPSDAYYGDDFVTDAEDGSILLIFIPTYSNGEPHEDSYWICRWLDEATNDFRYSDDLNGLKFAIFGLGDSAYGSNFCMTARKVNDWLLKLGAKPLYPTFLGDVNSHVPIEEQYSNWYKKVLIKLKIELNISMDFLDESDSEVYELNTEEFEDNQQDFQKANTTTVTDLEDIVMGNSKNKNGFKKEISKPTKKIVDMITPDLRKELTKQGYKLIGSHSGVKLCRWTKSMVRGRGGCYKNSFYGIESHRCMEATPSLACANKCVFCWRHHTNPVGTEWKWNMDNPELIIDGALKSHYAMINEFKGVPGVQPDRLKEAMSARHCALSLVGEPIMYPEINKFIQLLHERNISTFLVTNAQFPDSIKTLSPVTQLYVSVDASSKSSLKKIDRPLFRDFWERFIESLKALGEKGQRTVYRLTLVKSWNSEDIDGYAKLVSFGYPDFIEIKGVTYCGTSMTDSNLTMKNVPWHEEVVAFGEALCKKINQIEQQTQLQQFGWNGYDNQSPLYSLACEHEHSNCILLAHRKFYFDNCWHTWIDYEKFNNLISDYYKSDGQKSFTSLDYVARTPSWAVYGAKEQGFNPKDKRFRRKR
ncbi:S-adenosyl-L-methionine-dependent tRNA 4-demethylwyosine synthase [Blomia tropicalis]|nr:S-adenosyl-L-methionine-dependent tRNA 4-demethylwyosine synthase [Blomia tropicalis]